LADLPENMNGGRWGEVIRVHVHSDGNIWVFHRCLQHCAARNRHLPWSRRGQSTDPSIYPSGKLLKSLGSGMFVNPHGFTVDHEGKSVGQRCQ